MTDEAPAPAPDPKLVARGVAARLAIIAIVWAYPAVKLAILGWPWALSGSAASSALAVSLGVVLGVGQGWFIATRSGSRIVRWSREAAVRRSRDLLLLVRGFIVAGAFATLGIAIRHNFLEKHPVFVGGVYVLASTSLVVAALGLVQLARREVSQA